MDVLLDLAGSLGWLVTPTGIVAVGVITFVVLTGLPGKLVLLISAKMFR